MKVYGLWWGGQNYAVPYVDDHTEVLDNLRDAIQTCQDRYDNRDGMTPCVSEESIMDVFLADPRDSDDPYPDYRIQFERDNFTLTRC